MKCEMFYEDISARNVMVYVVIDTYLERLKAMVGCYGDSASEKWCQVDGESIALVLDKNEFLNLK